jgi:hypothetical protein
MNSNFMPTSRQLPIDSQCFAIIGDLQALNRFTIQRNLTLHGLLSRLGELQPDLDLNRALGT